MTAREAILSELRLRLRTIAIANGFVTDAGGQVFLGEAPQLGQDDPSHALALVLDDDEVNSQGYLFVTLPVVVQALAKADLNEPWVAIEAMLGDIKVAIEQTEGDRTLGGLLKSELRRGSTRTVPREPGGTTVGAAITYRCEYVERWGTP